jgi:hypothetical protein
MRGALTLVGVRSRRPVRAAKREKGKSRPFPTGVEKDGLPGDLRGGPTCGRAFRFDGEREDGYLVEEAAAAAKAAWTLALPS